MPADRRPVPPAPTLTCTDRDIGGTTLGPTGTELAFIT